MFCCGLWVWLEELFGVWRLVFCYVVILLWGGVADYGFCWEELFGVFCWVVVGYVFFAHLVGVCCVVFLSFLKDISIE